MKNRVSGLEDHLGYWLRFVSNHVSHAFALKVEALGVTVAEWVVLRSLVDSGEVNPSRLADSIGMTRGAVSKLIDRLEAKKYVERRTGKKDRRFQLVAISAGGERLVPRLAAAADSNDAEFFGHMKESERRAIAEMLREVVGLRGLKSVPVE